MTPAPNVPKPFSYQVDVSSTVKVNLKDNLNQPIEKKDSPPEAAIHLQLVYRNGGVTVRSEYIWVARPKPEGGGVAQGYLKRFDVGLYEVGTSKTSVPTLEVINRKVMLSLPGVKEPETVTVYGQRIY